MRRIVLGVTAGALLASFAAAGTSAPLDPDHALQWTVDDVRAGQLLEVRLLTGAELTISTWDRDQISVLSDWTEERCPDAQIAVNRSDRGAVIETRYPAGHGVQTHNCSYRIEVRVPRRLDVRLRSTGGGVTITGLDGSVIGLTGGGRIELSRMKGEVRLRTGGGSIHVSDSNLFGYLITGGGDIDFENVVGPLIARSGSARGVVRGTVGGTVRKGTT